MAKGLLQQAGDFAKKRKGSIAVGGTSGGLSAAVVLWCYHTFAPLPIVAETRAEMAAKNVLIWQQLSKQDEAIDQLKTDVAILKDRQNRK